MTAQRSKVLQNFTDFAECRASQDIRLTAALLQRFQCQAPLCTQPRGDTRQHFPKQHTERTYLQALQCTCLHIIAGGVKRGRAEIPQQTIAAIIQQDVVAIEVAVGDALAVQVLGR